MSGPPELPPDAQPVLAARPFTLLGMPIHRRIVTGQRQISWGAVFILSLVWFTWGFHIFAGGLALTFTLQHYTNDPRILAFVRTINIIIMLGPPISYISDQVWTRLGRRRPFMIVAWAAACVAMFSFAFLPQTVEVINTALGAIGIPHLGEMMMLIAIITGYTTFYDLQSPMEPLFLECVPPHQRGRFFAIRGIVFSLAVLFFFQVLWPVYDHPVDLFGYLGWSDFLVLRGEQIIYIFAGSMFFITGGFLLFCVAETRERHAPNKSFRELFLGVKKKKPVPDAEGHIAQAAPTPELAVKKGWFRSIPIVGFILGYVKDVFLTWENYPFYIVLVIPGIEMAVWGDFGNIMQDRQFGYSKANQALWGFPMQVFTMVLLTPFAGWYADTTKVINKILRYALLIVGIGLLAGAAWSYRHLAPADVRELPDVLQVFLVAGLVAGGCMAVFIWIVETMLDFTGREHTKAWVSMLALLLSLGVNIWLYAAIRTSPDQIIPITLWMMLNVANGAFGALLGTFIGPMIYEYMPRSKMGTINSGRGLFGDGLRWVMMNLGGWWIWWYSLKTLYPAGADPDPSTMRYDYTAMYLMQFVLFIPAIAAKTYFLYLITKRKVLKWGILEVQGPDAVAAPDPVPIRVPLAEAEEEKLPSA